MTELAHLVWELQTVKLREAHYRKLQRESPEYINRATLMLLLATSISLLLGFIGNIIGVLQIDQSWSGIYALYIVLLVIEAALLLSDCIAAVAVNTSWFSRKMPPESMGSAELTLKRFSIINTLAICFLCDFSTNSLKFAYLHLTRYTSADINVPLLVSGVLCTVGLIIKVILMLLHFVWKQMTPMADPLSEKGPIYFPTSALTDTLLWGLCMMMPVVNLLMAASAMCMAFMTTTL